MTHIIALGTDEVRNLPYQIICETKESARWNTMTRKRRWRQEFTDEERELSRAVFKKAREWALVKGAPDTVKMGAATWRLWHKIGAFCASL